MHLQFSGNSPTDGPPSPNVHHEDRCAGEFLQNRCQTGIGRASGRRQLNICTKLSRNSRIVDGHRRLGPLNANGKCPRQSPQRAAKSASAPGRNSPRASCFFEIDRSTRFRKSDASIERSGKPTARRDLAECRIVNGCDFLQMATAVFGRSDPIARRENMEWKPMP